MLPSLKSDTLNIYELHALLVGNGGVEFWYGFPGVYDSIVSGSNILDLSVEGTCTVAFRPQTRYGLVFGVLVCEYAGNS